MSNPPDFFVTCSQIIADNQKKDTIRQSAATVMKALLAKKVHYIILRMIIMDFIGIGFLPTRNKSSNKHC